VVKQEVATVWQAIGFDDDDAVRDFSLDSDTRLPSACAREAGIAPAVEAPPASHEASPSRIAYSTGGDLVFQEQRQQMALAVDWRSEDSGTVIHLRDIARSRPASRAHAEGASVRIQREVAYRHLVVKPNGLPHRGHFLLTTNKNRLPRPESAVLSRRLFRMSRCPC